MKEKCPNCRKTLPGCNGQTAAPGDIVECGLCGHVWQLRKTEPCACGNPSTRHSSVGNVCERCWAIEHTLHATHHRSHRRHKASDYAPCAVGVETGSIGTLSSLSAMQRAADAWLAKRGLSTTWDWHNRRAI
jgi:hypothetical protein